MPAHIWEAAGRNRHCACCFSLARRSVAALPDGEITVDAFKDESGAPKKWREVGPLDYREVSGQTHLKFVADENGNIDYLASDDFLPVELIQRVRGLEQIAFLKIFGIGTIVICALTVMIWFGGWIVRRRFKRPLAMTRQQARLRLASRIGAAVYLAVVVGWIALITAISADELAPAPRPSHAWLAVLYVLGVLAIFGGIAMSRTAWPAWRTDQDAGWLERATWCWHWQDCMACGRSSTTAWPTYTFNI